MLMRGNCKGLWKAALVPRSRSKQARAKHAPLKKDWACKMLRAAGCLALQVLGPYVDKMGWFFFVTLSMEE